MKSNTGTKPNKIMSLHQVAIDAGATYACGVERSGQIEPELYTMSPAQLRAILASQVESVKANAYPEGRADQAKLELAGRDRFLAGLRATA